VTSITNNISQYRDLSEDSYTEHDDSRITYITQNLSSFHSGPEIECLKFNAQVEGLSLFNNSVSMDTNNNVTMVTDAPWERVRSSDRLKRKSSGTFESSNITHDVHTPKHSDDVHTPSPARGRSVRMPTPGPAPGTPMNFAEVVEPDAIRNAVVMGTRRSHPSGERRSDCDKPSARYLTRTASECTAQAKPSFVLQDNHISSSCDLSVSDEGLENKENRLKCVTPTSNSNELDTTKINITPRTKITRGHTKQLASQWEDRSNNSKFKSTRNSKKTATSRTTRSKSADPNNRLSRHTPTKGKPAVKTKRTPKATPSRSKAVTRTKSGDKTPKPAWRF